MLSEAEISFTVANAGKRIFGACSIKKILTFWTMFQVDRFKKKFDLFQQEEDNEKTVQRLQKKN